MPSEERRGLGNSGKQSGLGWPHNRNNRITGDSAQATVSEHKCHGELGGNTDEMVF